MTGMVITGGMNIQYADVSAATRTAQTTLAIGNCKVSTAQYKFGNASCIANDATSDLKCGPGTGLVFSSSDFTFEFWIYIISRVNNFPSVICNFNGTDFGFGGGSWVFQHQRVDNTKPTFWIGSYSTGAPLLTGTTTLANNTWYAIAITRSGNTFRMFINGNIEATSTAYSGSLDGGNTNRAFYISQPQSVSYFNGYTDEIRVSNIARYTANYTPSTTALSNDANTTLLLHCDGINGSTSFPDDNISLISGGGAVITL